MSRIYVAYKDEVDEIELKKQNKTDNSLSTTAKTIVDAINEVNDDVSTRYTKPNSGIPESDLEQAVQSSLSLADSAYQKPNAGIPKSDLSDSVQSSLNSADSSYQKPNTGIPKSDLSSSVQSSLGKADSAIQTEADPTVPSWAKATSKPTYTKSEIGLGNVDNTSDLDKPISTATQTALDEKADESDVEAALALKANESDLSALEDRVEGIEAQESTWSGKYDKPSGGIPKSDLASGVQSSLEKADSALQEHQSLSDYYTKSEVDTAVGAKYTKPTGGIPKTDLASAVQTSLGKADTALQDAKITDIDTSTKFILGVKSGELFIEEVS